MTLSASSSGEAEHPDVELIRAMARGEADAMEALYARHGSRILSYLLGQLPTRELAEEVLQDVMLAAWRGAAGFRGESKVLTWLLTIAHNRAINARRKKRPDQVELDPRLADPSEPKDGPSSAGKRIDVRRALRQLPDGHRAALDLVFYQGLSIAEAAQVLDIAEGTVKSRLHRAKAALKERMGGEVSRHE